MINLTYKTKSCLAFLALFFFLTIFYACDTLENDDSTVELIGNEIHILPDGSGYIDLYSLVKAQRKVTLNVTSQPSNGNLREMGTGLLRYVPFKDFKGRDAVGLSIYDENNRLLQTETIDIIIDEDSTNLPCIYTHDNWIYSSGSPLEANVLFDDTFCGDTSDLVVEIYRPNNSFGPHAGTAAVTAKNDIYYFTRKNVAEELQDTLVYKVYRASNPNEVGFATLAINVAPCIPRLHDDNYYLQQSSSVGHSRDTVNFDVIANDDHCYALDIGELTVIDFPEHANVSIEANRLIRYPYQLSVLNPTITDSLTYQICVKQQCYTAKVKIKIF